MTRAILHVGMHKTGSSFLQNTLHANRDILSDAGVLYPLSGLHLDSPQAGYRHLGLRRSLAQEGPDCFAMARLREEVSNSDCHTVIVSYEGFFTPDTNSSHLSQAFEDFDVSILMFLRHPVDYIESKYREWVRLLGDTGEIEQFLAWQWPFLDVRARAEDWETDFDRERMHVRSYDQLQSPTDILREVLELVPDIDVTLQPDENSNRGATNEYTLAKLLANRLRLSGTPVGGPVIDSLEVDYGGNGGRLLSDGAIDEIERAALPEFTALLERYGQEPLLGSRWTEIPRDTAFFDPAARTTIVEQLLDACESQRVASERRVRQRAAKDAAAVRTKKDLGNALTRLEQAETRSGQIEERLQVVTGRLTDTVRSLERTEAELERSEASLREATVRLEQSEERRQQTQARLETVQGRLQRSTVELADLEHRVELLKFWRMSNWIAYVANARRRLWRSVRRAAGTRQAS